MVLTVLPATIPDIREVYNIYFSAFKDEPILPLLFPGGHTSDEFRAGHAAHTADYWKLSPLEHTIKCVDTDSGNIVGMATWGVYWRERTEEEWKRPEFSWLQGKDREKAERLLYPLWDVKDRLWGGRKYIYCHVLAVDPTAQRRGIGRILMNWGMQQAETLHLPIYVESTMAAYEFYKSMGFEKLKESIIHEPEVEGGERTEVPLMVHMPRGAKDNNAFGSFAGWAEKGYPDLGLGDRKITWLNWWTTMLR